MVLAVSVFSARLRRPPVIAILLLGLSAAFGSLDASAQETTQVAPAAKNFKLGALNLTVLSDSAIAVPNDGSVFGQNVDAPAAAKILSAAGAPTDKIHLDLDVLLVRMPGHLVLLDTGFGAAGHGVMQQSLSSAGVSPDQITDIFITHKHSDHVGGLVNAQGGSAFPKATIRMSSKEWEAMQADAEARPLVSAIKAQVQTFEPGQPVLPGITPIDLPGHTPGHVGYEVASGKHKLLDIGDMAHSSIISLAKPGWMLKWEFNPELGAKTRTEELQRLATTHELIFAPHFPFPGVGRIERAGDGFTFRPDLPSAN